MAWDFQGAQWFSGDLKKFQGGFKSICESFRRSFRVHYRFRGFEKKIKGISESFRELSGVLGDLGGLQGDFRVSFLLGGVLLVSEDPEAFQ